MKKYIRRFKEEGFDVKKAVKTIIETEWSKDDDVGKAIALLKGLAFSDDPKAKKFIGDLDALTSTMSEDKYE